MIGSIFGLSTMSAIAVGSGFKLKQIKSDYDKLCYKKNNVQIYDYDKILLNTQLNTQSNIIIKINPNDIPNKKAFVGIINLFGYRNSRQLVLTQNNNTNKYKYVDIVSKIPLKYNNISSTYGLENTGLKNIITNEGAIISYFLSKSTTYTSLDILNKELEEICGVKLTYASDLYDFLLEKYFVNLNKPIFMYGYLSSKNIFVCDLMSNHKELVINKIYEHENDQIVINTIGYSTVLCCGLLGSIYFLFELQK
jgi:hypothetical protein